MTRHVCPKLKVKKAVYWASGSFARTEKKEKRSTDLPEPVTPVEVWMAHLHFLIFVLVLVKMQPTTTMMSLQQAKKMIMGKGDSKVI